MIVVTELAICETGQTRDNPPLIHRDPRALGSIEQPLEMESRQAILRLLTDMSRKGRNCTCVLSFEQGIRVEIAFSRRIIELLFLQGLECSDHLTSTSQHEITDRPPTKILDPFGQPRADTDTGAELFVGGLKARGHVDRIAIGGVVEKAAPPKFPTIAGPA